MIKVEELAIKGLKFCCLKKNQKLLTIQCLFWCIEIKVAQRTARFTSFMSCGLKKKYLEGSKTKNGGHKQSLVSENNWK